MTFSEALRKAVIDLLNYLPGGNFEKKEAFKKLVGCDEDTFWTYEKFHSDKTNILLSDAETLMSGLKWRWNSKAKSALKAAIKRDRRSPAEIADAAVIGRSIISKFLSGKQDIRIHTVDSLLQVVDLAWCADESVTAKAGFPGKTTVVPVDNANDAMEELSKHFSTEQLIEAAAAVREPAASQPAE